jgi:serine/threonine protein kinase
MVIGYEYAALGSLYNILHGKFYWQTLVDTYGYKLDFGRSLHEHCTCITGIGAGEVHDQNAPILPWMQRVKVVVGIARGLEFLHKQNITHGNIKASKILIFDDYVPKIGDFISNTTM